jgi:hypothetical protein
MSHWIELAPRTTFLRRTLQHATNIAELPPLTFTRKGVSLSVMSNQHLIASVEGWTSLRVGTMLFRPKMDRMRLIGLTSDDFSLLFDWNCDDRADSISVGITSSRDPKEQYTARKDISLPLKTKTRATVESECAPHDLNLMIACLAYLWNYFEIDRTTYA